MASEAAVPVRPSPRPGAGALDEVGPLRRVALRHPRDAFGDEARIAAEWRMLNYPAPPDLGRAVAEYDRFVEILAAAGAEIVFEPAAPELTLDSIYVRDSLALAPDGIVLCRMGKAAREAEPLVAAAALETAGVPVVGAIEGEGRLEGGDIVWFDAATVAVAEGYRTNAEGIRQYRALLGPGVEVIPVPLPHYRGPDDVFHLMSILSPVDRDLALVHSRLMPVPFRRWLLARGIELVEVPEEEFESMGCNVLALAPREVVMLAGNPATRRRLEARGVRVHVYEGREISVPGAGGPTCLARPLLRAGGNGDG